MADPTAGPGVNDPLDVKASRVIAVLSGDVFDPAAPASDEVIIDRLDHYVALTARLDGAVALGAGRFGR